MRQLLACLLLMLCVGCHKSHPTPLNEHFLRYDDPDDLTEIIWDYATKLKYEKHLHLQTAYVCADETHSKLHIEFISQDILELCAARQLLVDAVEGLLDHINFSPAGFQLRPQPFTADDLELYIDFESYYGIYVDPFYIGWIALEEGMSYFYAFTLKNRKLDLWHHRFEAYSKSRAFAYAQRDAEEFYKQTHGRPRRSSVMTNYTGGYRRMMGESWNDSINQGIVPNRTPLPTYNPDFNAPYSPEFNVPPDPNSPPGYFMEDPFARPPNYFDSEPLEMHEYMESDPIMAPPNDIIFHP